MSAYENPQIPEGINVSPTHPLKDFALLLGGVSALIVVAVLALSFAAGYLVRFVPFEQERALASSIDANWLKQSHSADDKRREQYLQALGRQLAAAMDLPAEMQITVHYASDDTVNAMATLGGNIVVFQGLIDTVDSENALAMVLAHEIAHITNEDLRVMGLADSVSRLTSLLALMGQIAILLSLPALLVGAAEVYWPGLLLLAASPQLALLAQLGLSRVREFDADRLAAELTGDPQGLASALAKIERVSRSWRAWLWPGWGNPEPSWLRTHPATQERISRLLTLAPGPASALPLHAPHFLPESAVTPRPPRWRPSGLWR